MLWLYSFSTRILNFTDVLLCSFQTRADGSRARRRRRSGLRRQTGGRRGGGAAAAARAARRAVRAAVLARAAPAPARVRLGRPHVQVCSYGTFRDPEKLDLYVLTFME